MFPRGKTPTDASASASKGKAKPRSNAEEAKGAETIQGQGGRKRKAVGSASPGGENKDWLFGAPQSKQSAAAGGKKARERDDAGPSTGRVRVGKGKVCRNTGRYLCMMAQNRAVLLL